MGRWLLSLVAVAGCGDVLGLEELYECPPDDDDCDMLLDDVDPCPADPGDKQDEDGDGVGDACDPNLMLPGDTISQFDGFATANEAWLAIDPQTGVWRTRDSALVQDEIADGLVQRMVDPVIQPTVEVYIDLEFAGEGSVVGAYVGTPANVPLECRIVHHETGDDLVMLIANTVVKMATNLPGKPSDGLRIYGGQLPNGVVRCRARYGTGDGLFIDLDDPVWRMIITPRAMIDRLGLRTIAAKAQFHSVVLYSVP